MIRQAARDGGIETRISEEAFVYLDKNYVRILGGIKEAIHAAAPLSRGIVVQVRGETAAVEEEAVNAAEAGAAVVMVDTGRRDQLSSVIASLKERDLRSRVQVAFAGNLEIEELNALAHLDLDIVDIGYAILDAPCLPMRFDVIEIV
jgi:nicotinate-nucleotide pyrophosphorylase (carboxylating)